MPLFTVSSVTQATNKQTSVTINTLVGQIVTNNESLAAGAETAFTVSNSTVNASDVIAVSLSGTTGAGKYSLQTDKVVAGAFNITISNLTAGSLGEALTINFNVLKVSNA